MIHTYWPDGTVATLFDSEAALYFRYDEVGVEVERRPLTQAESDLLDPEAPVRRSLDSAVAAQVPDLLVMIDGLKDRLDIPKAGLGNTELRRTIRDVRVLARDVIQLARLVGNVLDSTDSGTP